MNLDRGKIWLVCAALVLLLALWAIPSVPLLLFSAILVALGLDACARLVMRGLPVGRRAALVIVLIALPSLGAGIFFAAGDAISEQVARLGEELPAAIESLRASLSESALGQRAIDWLTSSEPDRGALAGGLSGVMSSTIGGLVNLVLVLLVGTYLAFDPTPYRRGFLRLIAPRLRERATELIECTSAALQAWLLGRLLSMAAVGTLTGLGLAILGVPLAPILGLLAGLLSFVPNIGPILSAIPGVLLGFAESPGFAAQVAGVYIAAQMLEGWVITPAIQKRAVSIQPAVLLVVQVLFGVLFGLFGLLLATPLTVALMVATQLLVIEDIYGEEARLPAAIPEPEREAPAAAPNPLSKPRRRPTGQLGTAS